MLYLVSPAQLPFPHKQDLDEEPEPEPHMVFAPTAPPLRRVRSSRPAGLDSTPCSPLFKGWTPALIAWAQELRMHSAVQLAIARAHPAAAGRPQAAITVRDRLRQLSATSRRLLAGGWSGRQLLAVLLGLPLCPAPLRNFAI